MEGCGAEPGKGNMLSRVSRLRHPLEAPLFIAFAVLNFMSWPAFY
jgi:hypothetical protein